MITFRMKMENFSSGPPPEPRSPDMQRFRSGDHSRQRGKEEMMHYDDHNRRSGSPVYFDNHYPYRSPSPNNRPFSPNRAHLPMSPPPSRELSPPPLRDRSRRRRTPPLRRDRSRDRRRRLSPRRRTPPSARSPVRRRGWYIFIKLHSIFFNVFLFLVNLQITYTGGCVIIDSLVIFISLENITCP